MKKVLIALAFTMMIVLSFGVGNAAEAVLYDEDFTLHPTGIEPIDWDVNAFIDPGAYCEVIVEDVHLTQGNGMEFFVDANTDSGYADAQMDILFGSESAVVQFDLWMELTRGSFAMFDFMIVQDEVYLGLFFDYATNTLFCISDFIPMPIGVFDFSDYVTVKIEMNFSLDTYDLYVGDMVTPVLADIPLLPGPPSGLNYVYFSLSAPAIDNEAYAHIDNILITAIDPPPVINPRTGDMGTILLREAAQVK